MQRLGRFIIRDLVSCMSWSREGREAGAHQGVSNLDQSEEDQERRTLGEKDRQMREGGPEQSLLLEHFCSCLVSGGQTEGNRSRASGPHELESYHPQVVS